MPHSLVNVRKSEHIPARVLKLAERSASWKTDFDPSARIVGEALEEKCAGEFGVYAVVVALGFGIRAVDE